MAFLTTEEVDLISRFLRADEVTRSICEIYLVAFSGNPKLPRRLEEEMKEIQALLLDTREGEGSDEIEFDERDLPLCVKKLNHLERVAWGRLLVQAALRKRRDVFDQILALLTWRVAH